jgi:hypothetical protein
MFNNRRIIDAHAHIYPQKIAKRAARAVEDFYASAQQDEYGLQINMGSGELNELLDIAKEANVVKIVVSSVATSKTQVQAINNFMAESAASEPMLIPYATLSPEMDKNELRTEIARIKTLGIRGIKLHPDFQRFELDGEVAFKIFEELDGTLPLLIHTGDKRFSFSSPKQMVRAATAFKHLTFACAHLGGWSQWDNLDGYLKTPNTFFDTSSSLMVLSPKDAARIIRTLGIERFMFGTDWPMWNYKGEWELIEKLNLSEDELDKLLFKNACRFFNLDIV